MFRSTLFTTFVAALLLMSSRSQGQVTFSVVYDSLNFIQPPTVNMGGVVTYSIAVRNNSPTVTYSGPVAILRRVDNGPSDTIFVNPADSIAPQDTSHYQIQDSVTMQRFGGGINGVVIWPTAPNTVTLDTAFGYLEVIPVANTDPDADVRSIMVYPNPSSGSIRFRPQFSPQLAEETALMDGQGRVLRKAAGLPVEMDLNDLASGIYFLEVRMRDGYVHRFKVIRRD